MSTEQLAALAEQRKQLEAQLAQLAAQENELKLAAEQAAKDEAQRKAEEERRKLLETPTIIRAASVEGSMVLVKASNSKRPDVYEQFTNTTGRHFRFNEGQRENLIPIGEWKGLRSRLLQLPYVSVTANDGVEDRIHRLLNAPKWDIDFDGKHFRLLAGPDTDHWHVTNHERIIHKRASDFSENNPLYLVPSSEGYRIPEVLTNKVNKGWNRDKGDWDIVFEPIAGVVYSKAATAEIERQILNRATIDSIAKLEDAPEILDELKRVGWLRLDTDPPKPFQRVGIKFGKATNGRFILSDSVGLGKTLQEIAVTMLLERKKVLVICPASLKPNWVREIKKWTGLDAAVLSGGNPAMWAGDFRFWTARFIIANYDIVGKRVTGAREVPSQWNPSIMVKEGYEEWPAIDFLKRIPFDHILLDEAHYCKNPHSNRAKAVLKLSEFFSDIGISPMTGHPIFNRPIEFYPLLNIVAPNQFGSEEKFADQYGWSDPKNTEQLHKLVRPFFLRRKKSDVFKDLPPINRINEFAEMSDRARALYKKIETGLYTSLAEYDPDGQGGVDMKMMSILAQITRMKQVCAADKIKRCAELATEVYDAAEESDEKAKKVLIFTGFKGTAYNIRRLLGQEALSFVDRVPKGNGYQFITVDAEERDRRIQQFQNDPQYHYLVVTEKATREGHNITAAGTVIFNDLFWTPAAHEQAEGRAYGRIGDMHSINSHYLIIEKSIEERIMQILARKFAIIEQVVEGIEDSRGDGNVSIAKELIRELKSAMWQRD